MSAWGSYGGALAGATYQQILSFYYPGTALSSVSNDPIRVRLTTDPAGPRVSAADGLTAVESSGARTLLPTDRDQWRLTSIGSGLQLQGRLAGAWTAFALSGSVNGTAPVHFEAASGLLRVWRADDSSTVYRGSVAGVSTGSGAVTAVLSLPLESYLRGVVPKEYIPSWPGAALQSEAVAARTVAMSAKANAGAAAYDICDTTACQVFGGTTAYSTSGASSPVEYASTDAAVAATSGTVLTYQGKVAVAYYSASNGGWSVGGGSPYLPSQPDPWDAVTANPVHSWKAQLPASALESAFPAVGTVLRLVVTGRDGHGDWGGRVVSVRIEGTAGSVTTTGYGVMNARPYPSSVDGVRSNWWTIDDRAPFGSFDGAPYAGGATANVAGWAIDPDTSAPVTVRVVVDGKTVAETPASMPRPDVGAAYPASGPDHGYVIPVVLGGGSHQVCVQAVNLGSSGGYSQVIGCRPWTMSGPTVPPLSSARSPLVVSPGGRYWLAMQSDGNLVVYDAVGHAHWATMTNVPGSTLHVQADGNVVLYDASGFPLWTTGVYSPGAALQVQDDGNLVLYAASGKVLWDAFGFAGQPSTYLTRRTPVSGLPSGGTVSSSNGRLHLTMQGDGDLVLGEAGAGVRWATGTTSPGSRLAVQSDGNVVVYAVGGRAVWNSATYSPGARLALQDDGNLVLYDVNQTALWDAYGYTGHTGVRLT